MEPKDQEINRLTYELEKSRESHMRRIAELEAENLKMRKHFGLAFMVARELMPEDAYKLFVEMVGRAMQENDNPAR